MSDVISGTVEFPLTKGQVAIVDTSDADLALPKWQAIRQGRIHRVMRKRFISKTNRPTEYLHRLIVERMIGRSLRKGEEVDHRNGNPLDNRRSNLRLATHTQNTRNTSKKATSQQPYKGIRQRGTRWQARISVNKSRVNLGFFGTPEEAYDAYCKAAKQHFGEFARLT